jgi:hypothetical protein
MGEGRREKIVIREEERMRAVALLFPGVPFHSTPG